jgi:hypothetical protein
MSPQEYFTIIGFAVVVSLFFLLLALRFIPPEKTYRQPSQANTHGQPPEKIFPESKVIGTMEFYDKNKPQN